MSIARQTTVDFTTPEQLNREALTIGNKFLRLIESAETENNLLIFWRKHYFLLSRLPIQQIVIQFRHALYKNYHKMVICFWQAYPGLLLAYSGLLGEDSILFETTKNDYLFLMENRVLFVAKEMWNAIVDLRKWFFGETAIQGKKIDIEECLLHIKYLFIANEKKIVKKIWDLFHLEIIKFYQVSPSHGIWTGNAELRQFVKQMMDGSLPEFNTTSAPIKYKEKEKLSGCAEKSVSKKRAFEVSLSTSPEIAPPVKAAKRDITHTSHSVIQPQLGIFAPAIPIDPKEKLNQRLILQYKV